MTPGICTLISPGVCLLHDGVCYAAVLALVLKLWQEGLLHAR
jgi:hypothetical protein